MTPRSSSRAVTALLCALVATAATAQAPTPKPGSAYWRDSQGLVIRDASGQCVRAGYFTPELATEDCDPQLIKRPAPPTPPPPTPEPPPAPRAALPPDPQIPVVAPTPQSVRLSADTLFDFDQSRLKPSGETALRGLFDKSRGATIEQVRVEGHTDATGPKAYNQRLSERRADAVKDFLVGLGLSPALIVTESFGEEKPIASNRTREGRAQNRRVEVELLGSRLSK